MPPFLPDVPATRRELRFITTPSAALMATSASFLKSWPRQGVLENTCILFLSDNGRPFPRCKTTVYDGGIKTPWLVRWPARVPKGTVCPGLVSSVDIAPTFLELAGVKPGPTFQGRSFVPPLADPRAVHRDYIYAEHNKHNFEARECTCRGSQQFKYIRNDYHDLPHTPPVDIILGKTFQAMCGLRDAGKLTSAQRHVFVKPARPRSCTIRPQTRMN